MQSFITETRLISYRTVSTVINMFSNIKCHYVHCILANKLSMFGTKFIHNKSLFIIIILRLNPGSVCVCVCECVVVVDNYITITNDMISVFTYGHDNGVKCLQRIQQYPVTVNFGRTKFTTTAKKRGTAAVSHGTQPSHQVYSHQTPQEVHL